LQGVVVAKVSSVLPLYRGVLLRTSVLPLTDVLLGFDDTDRVLRSSWLYFSSCKQHHQFDNLKPLWQSTLLKKLTEVQQHIKVFTKQGMEMELTQAK
jgi:hypothetical protein